MTLKREKKTFSFEVKNIIEDEEFFTIEGYASTFGNVDYGNDVIVKGAFIKSISEQPSVPMLHQHSMNDKIGDSIELREDDIGLYIKAIFPKSDTMVSGRIIPQMRSTIKAGRSPEMSIGFYAILTDTVEKIRYIKEIQLFEVSLVTKAMNSQALVNNLKSMESLKDVEQSLKDLGLSNTEAKGLISKIKEFSNQRDVEEKQVQREAEEKANVLKAMEELTNLINKK
jgi:HK97 family phage prohead protease